MKQFPIDWTRLRGANNEGVLVVVLVCLIVAMSIASPKFFTLGTLYSVVFNSMVPTVFALAVLLVLISGGIDVSFAAVAIFAAYTTVKLETSGSFDPGLIVSFLIAIVIGALLGLVNGAVISRFRLPTLITTLGTQTIFKGVLLTYVGSAYISVLPHGLGSISQATIFSSNDGYLHVLVIPVVLLALLVSWVLSRTLFGRSVYAIGGDIEAARRVGFHVVRTQLLLYVVVGAIAAFGGVVYVILGRSANPQTLVGDELDTIASVVLGGASIFGGRGSVAGTVLGVLLVQLIENSLLLIGVPTAWQRAAVGALLIIGVGIQALVASRGTPRTRVLLEEVAAA